MIENGGKAAGDSEPVLMRCSRLSPTDSRAGVDGYIRKGGDFVNGYGDKIIAATATQDGPMKKTAVKPAGKENKAPAGGAKKALPASTSKPKALPAPSPSSYTSSATKALPSAGAKKALPASTGGAGVKKTISAESRPKTGANAGKPTTGAGATKTGASKTTTNGPTAMSKPGGGGKPGPPSKAGGGKVSISAESRPKPAKKV